MRELPKMTAGCFVKSVTFRCQPEMFGPELTATHVNARAQTNAQYPKISHQMMEFGNW